MAIEKHLLGRIIHKHDIEENWDKATGFIPQQGEIIVYDIDDNYEYERFKIGDGKTTVINLPFQKTNINDLKAVSYDIAQELTDEQKIQARANIGAGEPQVQSDLSQTDEAASDYVKGVIRQESLPEGYPYEEVREVVILPETEFSTVYAGRDSRDSITVDSNFKFEDGIEYIITFNGAKYICKRNVYNEITFLGNAHISYNILPGNPFDSMDTNEPFMIFIKDSEPTTLYINTINPIDCSVSIVYDDSITHAIDYKYMPEGYPYEESLEVFSVENAEFTDGQYINETPFVITDGNTYIVNWDGIEYTCVAYTFEGFPAISNTLLFGGTGNGEPFIIGYDSEANVNFITALNDFTDGLTATHTVSVVENVVHTIDHKYIKDMYYDNGSTTTVLVDNQTVTGFEVREDPIYEVKNPFSFAPTVGATYTVTWDGTVYECTASVADGLIYIGNVNYLFMESGGDVPFAIVFDVNDIFLATESTEESHTISITEVVHDMKQLDEKYLPILEEVNKTAFSMDGIINGNEYESSNRMLTGVCRVTVDGVSEDIEFVNDIGYSWAEGSSYYIATLDYGIYFEFQDDEPHSVKIEIPVNVVKEEYLPDDIQADWSQNDEASSDYIKGRTHYMTDVETILHETSVAFEENRSYVTVSENVSIDFVEGDSYRVILNGIIYDTRVHPTIFGQQVLGNADIMDSRDVDNGLPFLVTSSSSTGLELQRYTSGNNTLPNDIVISIEKFTPKTLSECYLPQIPDDKLPVTLVPKGGTGWSTLESGRYLVGNGTNAVSLKSPNQVLADIGAAAADHTHDEFVKNGDTELILTSSTAGSTKKFRITIDDNGVLTTEEVSE